MTRCKNFKELKKKLPELQEKVFLNNYTSFKIGGPANYFYKAKDKDELIKAIKIAKEFNLPFFILGKGSNVLFSDKGFDGLVIKCQMSNAKCQENEIYAEAGAELDNLVKMAEERSLTGLEWAMGIPGTIGGAVYGNAQAFDNKISDIVKNVEFIDQESFKIRNFSNQQCQFSIKNSIFKINKKLIILSVILKLRKGDKREIREKVKEFLSYRKEKHPLNLPSAGSIFINPVNASAGCLIEQCGLKGRRIGQAQISQKHANFIVNLGQAKAEDVLKLIKQAKQEVKKKFGIELKEEIQIIL